MNVLFWIPLTIIAGFFIYAGYTHYQRTWFYYKITPPWIKKWKKEINIIVGIAEVLGGIGLLIPHTRILAAWGLIALLIAVFPANIYMLTDKKAGMKIPRWFLWLRIPLQFILIWWVYQYTTN